jgi:uncharacterized membrane protein YdbT with pleckstrin-like domain
MLFTTIPLGVILGGLSIALVFTGMTTAALSVLFGVPAAVFVGLSPVAFASAIAQYGHIEYAITDQRFIQITDKVVVTTENSVSIEDARSVELNEGFLDRILGTGDIRIEATSGDSVAFNNIPNSEEIYRLCQQKIQGTDTADVGRR